VQRNPWSPSALPTPQSVSIVEQVATTCTDGFGKSPKAGGHRQSALADGRSHAAGGGLCRKEGIRPIDGRHEQAAALMGQTYSRLLRRPSVCVDLPSSTRAEESRPRRHAAVCSVFHRNARAG